jgi:argininosuccinate lyase
MAFAPDYVRLVLEENFRDARARWLEPLMTIHRAHLVMMAEQRILPSDAARALRHALDALDLESLASQPYDPADEDLFFRIDRLLTARCGDAVAGQLRTARSRNDIDMTMYRMQLRRDVWSLVDEVARLRAMLITVALAHRYTIFAAHTHAQPAQATTVAHYLGAVIEQLERDTTRLLSAYQSVNECPLGACAITGTGFPIDRGRTSRLLGFAKPTRNTYGSIAAVDHLLEAASAGSILLVGLGRVIQDLLLWSTVEVGFLRLPDSLVQVSSIMPQKRNPVALEHARVLASRGMAELGAIGATVHNTPFGDIVDTEDDLQPLVGSAFRLASRAVALLTLTVGHAEMDVVRMREAAASGWVTATELADTLVRLHAVPFTTAHAITGDLIRRVDSVQGAELSQTLYEVSRRHGYPIEASDEDIHRWLSPEHFVSVRSADGEPAPDATAAALARARVRLVEDQALLDRLRIHEQEADLELKARLAAL